MPASCLCPDCLGIFRLQRHDRHVLAIYSIADAVESLFEANEKVRLDDPLRRWNLCHRLRNPSMRPDCHCK